MNNDDKILALKAQIAEKKTALTPIMSAPKTNLTFNFEQQIVNINTFTISRRNELVLFMIKLNTMYLAAKDLGLEATKVSGFTLEDWLFDCKQRLSIIDQKDKEKELSTLEQKLSGMLSSDKQVELELDNITSLLKDMQ